MRDFLEPPVFEKIRKRGALLLSAQEVGDINAKLIESADEIERLRDALAEIMRVDRLEGSGEALAACQNIADAALKY